MSYIVSKIETEKSRKKTKNEEGIEEKNMAKGRKRITKYKIIGRNRCGYSGIESLMGSNTDRT